MRKPQRSHLTSARGLGQRIDSEGDGRGEGVHWAADGWLDVEGHGFDLSLLDSRLHYERDFCLARRERRLTGKRLKMRRGGEGEAEVEDLGARCSGHLDNFG